MNQLLSERRTGILDIASRYGARVVRVFGSLAREPAGDELYLRHILEAIDRIQSYVRLGREAFLSTAYRQDAVIRQLVIFGEATERLPETLRAKYPEVSWGRLAGLHTEFERGNMSFELQAAGKLTEKHLPLFKRPVHSILDKLEGSAPQDPR